MDTAIVAVVISVACGIILGTIAYLLAQRDNQRQLDITKLEELIKKTAKLVLDEKDKTAALVLSERDKLALQFKVDQKELEEKLVSFRIKVAEEYATSTLVEKIMMQVITPVTKKLDEIEDLLSTKLDRREFERYEASKNG